MPVVLRTTQGRKNLFEEVNQTKVFKDVSMSTVYVLAAVYGCVANRKEVLGQSEWVTRHEYVSRDTQLFRMCQAIAVSSTDSIEILADEDQVFELIEEFANAGIIELHNRVVLENEADYDLQLLSDIKDL